MSRLKTKRYKTQDKKSLVTHFEPSSFVAEQYRTIRAGIQFMAVKNPVNVITVTSSLPNEGKSTTALNLAIVFAQQNYRVLLIDGDLRRPTIHYSFKADNYRGLTNLLMNVYPLSDVVQETSIPNLDLLTSGPTPPNPAELIGSKEMDRLINEARSIYDYIIIDTPPVLVVTDALLIAPKTDGAILITASRKTAKENAIQSKELLQQTGGKILGVILNRKKMKNKFINKYYY